MNLPLNGRIAIIDDQLKHALPLIQVFSQKQIPHTYYSGEVKYLPSEKDNLNDIRVLLLDINLIDDAEHEDKVLKASLLPVLNRVISEQNYPYVIVYWSRHEHHKNLVENLIFNEELKERKPIGFLSASKSSFFELDGTPKDEIEQRIDELFKNINALIEGFPAYNYLLNWENQVHKSADATLQEVFRSYHSFPDWTDNANFLINKLGESYSGRGNFESQNPEEKIKSSFQAFNHVFYDSLEFSTLKTAIQNPCELLVVAGLGNPESIQSLNAKLLLSSDKEPMEYSGAVIEDLNVENDKPFNDLLNNSIARSKFFEIEKAKKENISKSEKEIGNLVDKIRKNKREEIRKDWKKIYCVVTPLCDFVQKKFEFSRVVKGMLIKAEYRNCIDERSEAIFISPSFSFEKDTYIMVLHFRYFFTHKYSEDDKGLKPIFRIRQHFLAEVQSKLARHINRQGILFLEE